MSFLQINPRFADLLNRLDLRAPDQFIFLPAVVVSGHPDRHVARIMLDAMPAFIKREHRVRWRDRIGSWLAGFGFVSKSAREARTLAALEQAGVGCPEWIAYGEDNRGRAFLVVRVLTDAVELRQRLEAMKSVAERRCLARRLGRALAKMHAAGFDHPDLYAKHVFVGNSGQNFRFLDWQRSRRGPLSERRRVRDLAALNATMSDAFVSERERLACLGAYATATRGLELGAVNAKEQARKIRSSLLAGVLRETDRLLRKRRIREARVPAGTPQELIWLNGEALCITPQFLQELGGNVPDWLRLEQTKWEDAESMQSLVPLPDGRQGSLVRRRQDRPLHWLWTEFRRKPLMSPELRQAGVLFRRARQGENVPRLLAFGQRRTLPWRTESFLLTEVASTDEGRKP